MKGIHAGAAPNAAASQHANPSSTFLLLPQQLLDLRFDGRRRRRRRETLDDVALLVHQELGKVPLDTIPQQAALFALQKLVQRVRIVPVDLDLREQRGRCAPAVQVSEERKG